MVHTQATNGRRNGETHRKGRVRGRGDIAGNYITISRILREPTPGRNVSPPLQSHEGSTAQTLSFMKKSLTA